MKWNKIIILFLVFSACFALPSFAQKKRKPEYHGENNSPFGRKKREKHNQHAKRSGGLFHKRSRSKGNADYFATHSVSGRKGFFSRIFSGGSGGTRNASLRKTKPGKKQNAEQAGLFHRNRTNNKMNREKIHRSQKKERDQKRVRGNSVFAKKRKH